MRLILILCCSFFYLNLAAQEGETEPQENDSIIVSDEESEDFIGFDPKWDYDMIAKGGDEQDHRFSLVYDSIEAEKMDIFITDLQGQVLESFWSDSPQETGLLVTFSISKKPLLKGVYYLNVVADGRTREAARIEVD